MRVDNLKYNACEICSACNGVIIRGSSETVFSGISTDSRDIKNGDLFVPLRGDNFNGFDFVIPALNAGARGSLVDNDFSDELPKNFSDNVLIKVKDTLLSLTDLASAHRLLFPIPLIAVTGSSGKTTVKEMIASILSRSKTTLATKGNLNNLIGLPMTVLSITPEYGAAVVEAGINHVGEMDLLAKAAAPDVAVISTIGPVHLEGLINVETVAREKFKMVQAASKAGVVPFGVTELKNLLDDCQATIFTFGVAGGDFRASKIVSADVTSFLMECPWGSSEINIRVPGKHNVANAMAAAAACLNLGANLEDVALGLESLEAPSWRMETVKLRGARILFKDYYNANPQSMKAALETLDESDNGCRKMAILGDMMELGALSDELHAEIGKRAASLNIERVIFIGSSSEAFAKGFRELDDTSGKLSLFEDKETAWEAISSEIGAYDRILVKASRSMKMEQIANRIIEEI